MGFILRECCFLPWLSKKVKQATCSWYVYDIKIPTSADQNVAYTCREETTAHGSSPSDAKKSAGVDSLHQFNTMKWT